MYNAIDVPKCHLQLRPTATQHGMVYGNGAGSRDARATVSIRVGLSVMDQHLAVHCIDHCSHDISSYHI